MLQGIEWFGVGLIVLLPSIVAVLGYAAARANLK